LRGGEKYNPETDTWSHIPDMRRIRYSMATAVLDDKIYVIGGDGPFRSLKRVEYFREEKNIWFVYS
jgi:kelch-like protein 10